jgi:hypothetical protein
MPPTKKVVSPSEPQPSKQDVYEQAVAEMRVLLYKIDQKHLSAERALTRMYVTLVGLTNKGYLLTEEKIWPEGRKK